MKKIISFVFLLLITKTYSQKCGCPELDKNSSNPYHLVFISNNCSLTLTSNVLVMNTITTNIVQTGSYYSNGLYHLGVTPTRGIPIDLNNFILQINNDYCTYNSGTLSVIDFDKNKNFLCEIYTIDGVKIFNGYYHIGLLKIDNNKIYIVKPYNQSVKPFKILKK